MEITRPSSRIEVDKLLQSAGYYRIGKGAFAAVYHKLGSSYALKIFDSNDRAYLDFISLVKSNNNKHFPIFYGKVIKITSTYSAIRMELLNPYKYNEENIRNYMRLRDSNLSSPNKEDAIDFMNNNPELKQACDLIIDNLLNKYKQDLKQSNLMSRGNTIVITDPVKDENAFTGKEKLVFPYAKPIPQVPQEINDKDIQLLKDLGVD